MSNTKSTESEWQSAVTEGNLGCYLRLARERKNLSQSDVAKKLKMTQFQSISQWERNASGSVPVRTLLKLVAIYELDLHELYDVLLKFQSRRMELKLEKKFFGKIRKKRAS